MKTPVILTILCGVIVALVYFAFLGKTQEVVQYEREIFQAPANLNDYPPKNAKDHGDGLYSIITKGANDDAQALNALDIATLSYKGWNSKGENFDASNWHLAQQKMRVDAGGTTQLIEGWNRIIPHMRLGETRLVWIPSALAYPNAPTHSPTHGRLLFEISVDAVDEAQKIASFDQFPVKPTNQAQTLPSGLVKLELRPSSLSEQVKLTDKVEVHMTIWTQDGKMVRNTQAHQRKLQLSLQMAVPAIREALLSMKVGEQSRFWVPQSLGYGKSVPVGFPKGDWICDLELLKISEPIKDLTSKRIRASEK